MNLRTVLAALALTTVTWTLAPMRAAAYTPTQTFGPSPTPTPTGTAPPPQAVITALPNPARPGQQVVLDATASLRSRGFYRWSQVGGDPAVQIEHADQAIASFVVPPLNEPAAVTVQLALGFDSTTAQQTIDLLPPETVRLEIDRVTGAPGQVVDVNVVLRPLGYAVTAVEHELRFDQFAAVATVGPGSREPDCTPGSLIAVDDATFTFLPEGCTPDVDCSGLRAAITTREPVADGTVLYRCNVVSHEQVSSFDCFHALACAGGEARRADGSPLDIACVDGGMTIDYAVSPIGFSLSAEPANPMVGDTVRLTVTAFGQGGLPAYSLRGAEPFLRVVSAPPPPGGPLGNPVVFETVADCPGLAQLSVFLTYETQCGCSVNPFFCFTSASSQTFPLTVREPGGFIVSGRVAEFPLGCQGAMRGVTVRLDPLGWTTSTDLAGGNFSFGAVPPGDYTLSVSPSCNPFGCWAPQPLQVVDADVALTLCPQRIGPGGCAGDCNDDGRVMVNELIAAVSIALGVDDLAVCGAADSDANDTVTIDDLMRAIGRALDGCPGVSLQKERDR